MKRYWLGVIALQAMSMNAFAEEGPQWVKVTRDGAGGWNKAEVALAQEAAKASDREQIPVVVYFYDPEERLHLRDWHDIRDVEGYQSTQPKVGQRGYDFARTVSAEARMKFIALDPESLNGYASFMIPRSRALSVLDAEGAEVALFDFYNSQRWWTEYGKAQRAAKRKSGSETKFDEFFMTAASSGPSNTRGFDYTHLNNGVRAVNKTSSDTRFADGAGTAIVIIDVDFIVCAEQQSCQDPNNGGAHARDQAALPSDIGDRILWQHGLCVSDTQHECKGTSWNSDGGYTRRGQKAVIDLNQWSGSGINPRVEAHLNETISIAGIHASGASLIPVVRHAQGLWALTTEYFRDYLYDATSKRIAVVGLPIGSWSHDVTEVINNPGICSVTGYMPDFAAFVNYVEGRGTLVAAAAGNVQEEISNFACAPAVMSVGSAWWGDDRKEGTSTARLKWYNARYNEGITGYVDVWAADGVQWKKHSGIVKRHSWKRFALPNHPEDRYFGGTSAALPNFAGGVARIMSTDIIVPLNSLGSNQMNGRQAGNLIRFHSAETHYYRTDDAELLTGARTMDWQWLNDSLAIDEAECPTVHWTYAHCTGTQTKQWHADIYSPDDGFDTLEINAWRSYDNQTWSIFETIIGGWCGLVGAGGYLKVQRNVGFHDAKSCTYAIPVQSCNQGGGYPD